MATPSRRIPITSLQLRRLLRALAVECKWEPVVAVAARVVEVVALVAVKTLAERPQPLHPGLLRVLIRLQLPSKLAQHRRQALLARDAAVVVAEEVRLRQVLRTAC